MEKCCFTGHRDILITPDLRVNLTVKLTELINDGMTEFLAGGSWGFDMFCEKTVLSLKNRYPEIRLHIVLPCPFNIQTRRWQAKDAASQQMILDQADIVEVLFDRYTPYCMKERNKRLIELSDYCICYCTKYRSGTGQTIRLAQKKGIDIYNLASEFQ